MYNLFLNMTCNDELFKFRAENEYTTDNPNYKKEGTSTCRKILHVRPTGQAIHDWMYTIHTAEFFSV